MDYALHFVTNKVSNLLSLGGNPLHQNIVRQIYKGAKIGQNTAETVSHRLTVQNNGTMVFRIAASSLENCQSFQITDQTCKLINLDYQDTRLSVLARIIQKKRKPVVCYDCACQSSMLIHVVYILSKIIPIVSLTRVIFLQLCQSPPLNYIHNLDHWLSQMHVHFRIPSTGSGSRWFKRNKVFLLSHL